MKPQNKYRLHVAVILLMLATPLLNACSKKSEPADIPIIQDRPSSPLNIVTVSSDGCLNLSKLKDFFENIPNDIEIREATTDITIEGPEGFNPNSKLILYKGAFVFRMQLATQVSDLSNFKSITQSACSEVAFEDDLDEIEKYQITKFDSHSINLLNSITLEQREIRIVGPQEIQIIRDYQAMDFCPNFLNAMVTHTRSIQWGRDISQQTVQLNADVLSTLASSTSDIYTPSIEASTSVDGYSAPFMQFLYESQVKPELLRCDRYQPDP